MGSGLGIYSQPKEEKIPKFSSIPAQRLLHPLPGLGSWRGTTLRAAAPKAQAKPQPLSCCQQPLTETPGTFPEAFPGGFPRLVPGKLLWQSRIWVCCSPGCGECPDPSFLGTFPWCSQSQGWSYGDAVPNSYLFPAGAPGQPAWAPWQLTVTLAVFWSVPLDKGDAQKGEKLQQQLRE